MQTINDATTDPEAKRFADFYVDLVENRVNTISYYLSESATLDWFGKTIKGERNITNFLKSTATGVKHIMSDPKSADKIGHRDTHVIHYPRRHTRRTLKLNSKNSPILTMAEERTPPNANPSSSAKLEQGQGDGLHNCDILSSPAKRCRIEDVILTAEPMYSPVKYVTMEGHVEFRKRSTKKYQKETKWQRPCKLEMAYSNTDVNDTTIHLIIYSCEMKCKRNLLKEFDSADD